jgi:hypothetical protein
MEAAIVFASFQAGAQGGSSLAIADVNGFGAPRDAVIVMGVPGTCVDNAGLPSMDVGCLYGLVPSRLSPGVTTQVNKLIAWEPVTGAGVGVSMAH